MKKMMNQAMIFDGRNLYDPKRMQEDRFKNLSACIRLYLRSRKRFG
jgi:hypothetical protein